ncbi:Tim44/TimA family putative adaptor protein [Paremcibacter congregatus]|uniref:Calcium-binding protein n=1 Tax=Paremcibacter congregatus TaxID=2043170 RepID=A0A2G4YPI5_9PROT|nr:Tim44/TimA family putative adaptor protein [Paremcibacter congregatus]PHZ84252.1 calcium-binding protein [Paremcibacter congregatus]QDE29013.1 Tim44 domain-containing protein [Paremcibacter congregatus]
MQTESESFELIIILALVAVFILFQLRRTLGKKTGYDPTEDQGEDRGKRPYHKEQSEADDNVISLRPEADKPAKAVNLGLSKSSPFYDVIEKVNQFDSTFNLRSFFDGAEYAYDMILNAFWDKDRKSLRSMLSREVFDLFDGAITALEKQNRHQKNRLMDIEKIDLVDATLSGSMAEITVEFTSHMIMSTVDENDRVVEGDPDRAIKIIDIWTFCRDVKSADPNWTLVATRTG